MIRELIAALSITGTADAQPVGATFRDCAECPEMVMVPAGSIVLGSPSGNPREQPLTEVSFVHPFAVGKYEITAGEFAAFVAATGYVPEADCDESPAPNWRQTVSAQTARLPAVCLNNEDASRYVEWLSGRAWFSYRLLSEAEWAYAARAGRREPEVGSAGGNQAGPSPVGSFAANAFGLHDMLGNVAEWTADCDHPTLAGISASPRLTGNCTQRGARGGSWRDPPELLRSDARSRAMADRRSATIGFRVGRSVSAP